MREREGEVKEGGERGWERGDTGYIDILWKGYGEERDREREGEKERQREREREREERD